MSDHTTAHNSRFVVKVSGESGQGIDSAGAILAKALKDYGFHIFSHREYPSLIKGGYANTQIEISNHQLRSSSEFTDILVSLSRISLHKYLDTVHPGGDIVHAIPKLHFSADEQKLIEERDLKLHYVDAFGMAQAIGQNNIFANIVFLGVIWKYLGLELQPLLELIKVQFASKPKLLELDLAAAQQGYDLEVAGLNARPLAFTRTPQWQESLIIKGNSALALGAIAAGARAYFSYPMTPSSSILTTLADLATQTGMVVKQAEDEITAAQMVVGAMFAGTRAFTATSGGGFDLMTETVSLAGMLENPLVIVVGQRPGPATGLPTWTTASDLNLALYSGHGEYPRAVLAASDPQDAFTLIQVAFNLAETYQIPVILLTEKQVGESEFNIAQLPQAIEIKRGLLPISEIEGSQRYAFTASGVSPRWLPGQSTHTYLANSDEHDEDGNIVEDALPAHAMADKRMRKLEVLKQEIPEPEVFGDPESQLVLVGWGSVKNAVLDVLDMQQKVPFAYVHYSYLYPVATHTLQSFLRPARTLVVVENNQTAQLGLLLQQCIPGLLWHDQLLKYDGRAFTKDDILAYLENYL